MIHTIQIYALALTIDSVVALTAPVAVYVFLRARVNCASCMQQTKRHGYWDVTK